MEAVVDQPKEQEEYSKPELVQLLTGVQCDTMWVDAATNAKLRISPSDMPNVHAAIMSYKANRVRCYGEEGHYTMYFMPAFTKVDEAFKTKNFKEFCEGCELMLGLIGND